METPVDKGHRPLHFNLKCEGLRDFEQLEERHRLALMANPRYIDLSFIPPTSNTFERVFNCCEHVLTE